MKKIKTRDQWVNEGHSYDNEIENARMMRGSAAELVEWANRKIAESRPENFKEGVIQPVQEAKESYKIMRLVNGRTKELIEGTIDEIMEQFSRAIDKLRDSGSGKQYKDDPKTLEELVKYLNAAQSYIDKGKSKITYEIQESVNEMKMVNKETGKDITKYVIQYMEKKITKKEFEKLTGLKKDELKVDEDSNIFEALNFIIRPAKPGDPFAPYGKPFFITTKDADLVVKKMNDLGIRTFTNDDDGEFEIGLETYVPKAFGYRTSPGLKPINQDVLQKALDVLDQRKDKITGFGWHSTNESVNEDKEIKKSINDIENGDIIVLGKNKHFKVDYIDPWSGGGKILVGKDVKTGKKGKMKVKFLTPRGNTGLADDTILNVLDESAITEGKSEEWMVTYKNQNFAGVKIKKGTVIKVLARNTEEAHKKAAKKLGLKDYYHALDAKATKVNESKWIPYSGFVNESPNIIANTIYENSNNLESAIELLEKCVSFNYLLLSNKSKANLEIAKRLLESKY